MDYRVETVPMPKASWPRRTNSLLKALRSLKVGQSIFVGGGDPLYRPSIVTNLNQSEKPKHFFKVPEGEGVRIFRDK